MNTSNEQLPVTDPEQGSLYAPNTLQSSVVKPEVDQSHNPTWTVFPALGLWLLSVVLVNVVPMVFLVPYFLIRYPGMKNIPQPLYNDHTAIFLVVLAIFPAHLLTFGAVWAVVTRFGKLRFWSAFGWSWSPRFGFWHSAGLAIALFFIGIVLIKLIGGKPTEIDLIIETSTAVRIVLAIVAATSGPFVEELVYRGVLFPALQKGLGTFGSVVLVSLLFAGVHVIQYKNSLGVITVIVMLSVVLTLVRAWTGRLLPCFIIHMVFNGVQSLLIVFHPYIEQFEKGLEPKTGLVMMLQPLLYTLT